MVTSNVNINIFEAKPVATLVTVMSTVYTLITILLGAHVLTGTTAAWATGVATVLGAVLGYITHKNTTPVANPRDSKGRRLVPESTT